jgi:nickel transport protein
MTSRTVLRRLLLPLAAVTSLGALAAGEARAHGIESSLQRLEGLSAALDFSRSASGERLELRSRFSSGLPATEAAVRLLPPDGGAPIEVGRTDAGGRLTFALPRQAGDDWEVQVDAGPGHRDYLGLSEDGMAPEGEAVRSARPDLLSRVRLSPLAPALLIGLLGGAGLRRRWRRRR